MVNKLILSLFPEGQRKVMVSLIVVAVGVIVDKFAGGLTDQLMTVLIAAAGIFTGGNIFEHMKEIFTGLKGSKLGRVIEDILPGEQGLGHATPAQTADVQAVHPQVVVQSDEMYAFMNGTEKQMAELRTQLGVQAQNVAQIVQLINQIRTQAANANTVKVT